MSEQENDADALRELARLQQFQSEIAPLRKAVMQGLIHNRVVDHVVELHEEKLRLRSKNSRLRSEISRLLLENPRLLLENSRLRSENSHLRVEIISIESKHSRETSEKVREARKAARRNSGCGCLVLMAAGLSAFSLFSIYQI